MEKVVRVIGLMTQLRSLNLSYNNAIDDFSQDYKALADRAHAYFINLAVSLYKLKQLEELHIQGLWLKSHKLLKIGNNFKVSPEVAITTGIINHEKRKGIYYLINSIHYLPHLKKLSIDAIPSQGSSFAARDKNPQSSLFKMSCALLIYYDGFAQDMALYQFSKESAESLSKNASLKTINVYSPGGNCTDYFSKSFKENLKESRPSTMSELIIIPLALD